MKVQLGFESQPPTKRPFLTQTDRHRNIDKNRQTKTDKDRQTDIPAHSDRHSGQTKTGKKYRYRQTDIDKKTQTDRFSRSSATNCLREAGLSSSIA